MSVGALARELGVPRTRIERIAKEDIGITTNTALRLAKFFDTSPEFWVNLQTAYKIETQAKAFASELAKFEPRGVEPHDAEPAQQGHHRSSTRPGHSEKTLVPTLCSRGKVANDRRAERGWGAIRVEINATRMETFEITVNRRRFDRANGVKEAMTAGDIAALVGVPGANAVVEREVARGTYELVSPEICVRVEDRMHFLVTREFVMGG